MRKFAVILFCIATLAMCWLGMMAVHELGHVVGAVLSGGTVTKVVLSPVAISRTDVSPNPYPGFVVWLGPLLGCVLPLAAWSLVPRSLTWPRGIAQFFAGFCLIANGAYIGLGSFEQIGDCREMLRTGSPVWTLWLFGFITTPAGFWLWHRMGSPRQLLKDPIASDGTETIKEE